MTITPAAGVCSHSAGLMFRFSTACACGASVIGSRPPVLAVQPGATQLLMLAVTAGAKALNLAASATSTMFVLELCASSGAKNETTW